MAAPWSPCFFLCLPEHLPENKFKRKGLNHLERWKGMLDSGGISTVEQALVIEEFKAEQDK